MTKLSDVLCLLIWLLSQVQGEVVNYMQEEMVNDDMTDNSESIRRPDYDSDNIYMIVRLPGESMMYILVWLYSSDKTSWYCQKPTLTQLNSTQSNSK